MICVQGNHEACVTNGLPPDPGPGLLDDDELLHQHWTHSRLDQARRDFIRGLPHAEVYWPASAEIISRLYLTSMADR